MSISPYGVPGSLRIVQLNLQLALTLTQILQQYELRFIFAMGLRDVGLNSGAQTKQAKVHKCFPVRERSLQ
jgi:hypothetical protein